MTNLQKCYLSKEFDRKKKTLVAEMRELGVVEYTDGKITVKLGGPAIPVQDEKSDKEQQAIRDARERKFLEMKQRTFTSAASRIGPATDRIR